MMTTALRLYGKKDLRMESFELPAITEDELLVRIVSDTACMSTYKAVCLGADHKRVPDNIAMCPIVIGHEMCIEIIEVGSGLKNNWKTGEKAVIQPALNMPDNDYSVGYSFPFFGGNMTYGVIPKEVIERNCVLKTKETSFFKGSLVEPLSCILRAFKSMYHTNQDTFERVNGVKPNGKIAILGGAGPMGLGAIDIAIHNEKPSMVVVTDTNEERLRRAASIFTAEDAGENGIELIYVNVSGIEDQAAYLNEISGGGFDDIFIMVPIQAVLETADKISATDGCANFFAGPTDHQLSAYVNFYRVHYDFVHIIGTSGGTPEDTTDVIRLIEKGVLNPAAMITHIGGLNSVTDAILGMEKPSDGLKKICYNGIFLPMIEIADFEELGRSDRIFKPLHEIVKSNKGLWCAEAERYLLENAPKIQEFL